MENWRHNPHTRRVEQWERETPTGIRVARKLGRDRSARKRSKYEHR